jgi:hypothetical protein
VDEALEEIEEASRYEQTLAKRAEGISQNLHRALHTHNRYANDDITTALIEHARSSIMYERQLLRELEALRGDISNAAKKVVPAVNGVPKPSIIPPLEDDRPHPPPAPSAPIANGFQRQTRSQPPHTAGITQSGFTPHHVPTQPNFSNTQSPLPSSFPQTPTGRQDPLSAASFRSFSSFTPTQTPSSPTPSQSLARQQPPPQSPGAGPSSPATNSGIPARQAVDEPPLGGRFVDGTKSMFVPKSTSSPRPSPLSFSSSVSNIAGPGSTAPSDPLRSDSYSSPLQNAGPPQQPSRPQQIDPLGLGTPQMMSSSLRIQPTRPRLDAREAASKLANMF